MASRGAVIVGSAPLSRSAATSTSALPRLALLIVMPRHTSPLPSSSSIVRSSFAPAGMSKLDVIRLSIAFARAVSDTKSAAFASSSEPASKRSSISPFGSDAPAGTARVTLATARAIMGRGDGFSCADWKSSNELPSAPYLKLSRTLSLSWPSWTIG